MNIGDRVRVIELEYADKYSNIELNDEGVVICDSSENETVVHVKFDKNIVSEDGSNLNEDGSYSMFWWQLEVIGEEE